MKIVESAQQRNPEQITEQLNSLVDQLKSNVETAAQDGDSFDFVKKANRRPPVIGAKTAQVKV